MAAAVRPVAHVRGPVKEHSAFVRPVHPGYQGHMPGPLMMPMSGLAAATAAGGDNGRCTLYVGNLPLNLDEAALTSIFSTCGPISAVEVSRGEGFYPLSMS